MSNPLLSGAKVDDRLELAAGGSWTAVHAAELEALVEGPAISHAGSLMIDMRDVDKLDTFGAWVLERLSRRWSGVGAPVQFVSLPDHYRGLLDEVRHLGRQPLPPAAEERGWTAGLEWLGRMVERAWQDLVQLVAMLGQLTVAFGHSLLNPRSFRITSTVHQLDRVGWQAVPIILLITFLIGGIIAQQGFFHFRKFGADEYVVDLVGILVLREIGVLIVAIMVAGPLGQLLHRRARLDEDARGDRRAAHHGPRSRRDADAAARHRARSIALPMLTFLGSMAALYGGGLVAGSMAA